MVKYGVKSNSPDWGGRDEEGVSKLLILTGITTFLDKIFHF